VVGGRGRSRAQADLLQVRLCESRSDRELEVPYKPVYTTSYGFQTRGLYSKASPGSRSRGVET